MSTSTASLPPRGSGIKKTSNDNLQLVAFEVQGIRLGIDIRAVREINRLVEVTPVPDAPPSIHGVVNLRGEVVTVINAHRILGVGSPRTDGRGRNLILHVGKEPIGMLVDSVADIIEISKDQLQPCPANIRGIQRTFVDSVYLGDEGTVVVVDPAALLAAIDVG